jgi:threonine dehydrogenase-like Zn-dependent dehydrogenase
MPAQSCFQIPESMTATQAALVEPFSIGLYAQRLAADDLTGKAVAILGSGPIGLSVMLACQAAGARAIYMTDILDYRVEHARKMGADWAANPEKSDIVADILAAEANGVDYAFECAGEQETVDQAVQVTTPGGKILLVGIPEFDRLSFDVSSVRRAEISLQPVRRQNECVQDAIDLVAAGKVDLDAMVTHEMPLEDVERAYEILDDYDDNVIKAMVHIES